MAGVISIEVKNEKIQGAKEFQNEKEGRMRVFHEHQEEERQKRIKDIEQQFIMSKKHRELLEEERKRKIEEARIREMERRHQVEERKRQIWEAEQERKEAILRRNMEREARIEARRNAQRNSQYFAFGSSTPRTFDFELAAIGKTVNQGPVLMSSVSSRRSEERELGPPRATSACSLDRRIGEDLMSKSMISLSSSTFRGRKRNDLTPIFPRERSITPHILSRGKQCSRAVSMTRLDQLAQPRQPRNQPTPNEGLTASPSSMSKSMCNLANAAVSKKPLIASKRQGNLSQSMLHLADNPSHPMSPVLSPTQAKNRMRPAQSMLYLAPPKPTRAVKLRAQALTGRSAVSSWNLNKTDPGFVTSGKDTSRSPSRPQSSMSATSDISATSSSVSLRLHSTRQRPRPISVAGSIVDASVHLMIKKDLEQNLNNKNAGSIRNLVRMKSSSKDPSVKSTLQKPVPPPKSSAVLARAHHVSSKDNIRKAQTSSGGNKDLIAKTETIPKKLETHIKVDSETSKMETQTRDVMLNNTNSKAEPNQEAINDSGTGSDTRTQNTHSVELFQDTSTLQNGNEDIVKNKTEIIPNKTQNIPDKTQNIPDKTQNIPDKIKNIPDKTQNIPDKTQNIPNDESAHNVKELQKIHQEREFPLENVGKENTVKQRITSEEQARIALAEKRKLAREQAERDAELERKRLEEIRAKEEERIRLEEEEQRRMEEHQIQLAKLHQQLEEEKLRKAIEEEEQRKLEDQRRKDEEIRLKIEREEQERKAREEAERQRIELENKLKKEEEERAERKRRVELIMARTRNKMAQSSPAPSNKAISEPPITVLKENKSSPSCEGQVLNGSVLIPGENSLHHPCDENSALSTKQELLNIEFSVESESEMNGTHENCNKQLICGSDTSPQNGYNTHVEHMSCTASPEEESNTELLIDVQSCEHKHSNVLTDFSKLVDTETFSTSTRNENFLINEGDFNSNLINAVEDSVSVQSNQDITDLLS